MFRSLSVVPFVVLGLVASVSSIAPAATAAKIAVSVKNFAFSPATVTVHVGKPATLAFTTQEGVHGVASPGLGFPQTVLMPGKVTSVAFTPKKIGSYTLHCTVVCGAGHAKMMMTVKVVR